MQTARRPYLLVRLEGTRCSATRVEWPGECLGPVDLALRRAPSEGLTLGTGPMSSAKVPGSTRLVICGHSPCWEGVYVTSVGALGGRLRQLDLSAAVVTGRAAGPSALLISRHGARLVPLDAEGAWAAGGVVSMVDAVRRLVEGPGAALVAGPAAAHTLIGALGATALDKDDKGVKSWAGRGGFGSRLYQHHGLAAVVLEAEPSVPEGDPLRRAELGQVHPLLSDVGTLGANLMVQAHHVLGFNGGTAGDPEALKAVQRLVLDHYLPQYRNQLDRMHSRSCEEDCPAACRKEHGGRKKDYQPYMALGPSLGIFDHEATAEVVDAADRMGFDAVDAGGVAAWLMECVHAGLVDAGDVGLSARFRFGPKGFDPGADSQNNAAVATSLLQDLGMGRLPALFGQNLRASASALGGGAREKALYLANGQTGSICPLHYTTAGALAPVGLAGKYHTDLTGEVVEPRALGRRCAGRMVSELIFDNLGLCRFQIGLDTARIAGLLQGNGSEADLREHHVRLAAHIQSKSRPVFWETERVREVLRWSVTVGGPYREDPGPELSNDLHGYWEALVQGMDFH